MSVSIDIILIFISLPSFEFYIYIYSDEERFREKYPSNKKHGHLLWEYVEHQKKQIEEMKWKKSW